MATESKRGKRTLVLLVLNEIEGVQALVPKLPRNVADEIIAVDGGSTDGTVEYLNQNGIQVVGQSKRGRGEAFRVAARAAKGDEFVFFSPDGNENMADIEPLFTALESGNDMAIASRFLPESRNEEDDQALPLRKWTNQAFTLIANTLWNRGRFVTDTINGFRGVTREAFEKINPQSVGFTIEFELTIKALKKKLKVAEIPTFEGNRIGGETKAPSFKTGVVFLKFLAREILSRN